MLTLKFAALPPFVMVNGINELPELGVTGKVTTPPVFTVCIIAPAGTLNFAVPFKVFVPLTYIVVPELVVNDLPVLIVRLFTLTVPEFNVTFAFIITSTLFGGITFGGTTLPSHIDEVFQSPFVLTV